MRKNLLLVGIVLLVLGVALAGVATYETAHTALGISSGAGTSMYPGQNGDYYSNVLNTSSGSEIVVVSSAHPSLIPSKDLNIVNSTNVGSYAISPTRSTGSSFYYSDLNGTYNVVVFSASYPTVDYVVITGSLGTVAIYGILLIVGVILAIAGIIIAIIGAILKPKNHQFQKF